MSWLYLIFAIIAEVFGTTSMKLSDGFTKLLPSIMIFAFYGLSLIFLTLSLKNIELSMAYAIWAGLGTALIAIVGVFMFKESLSMIKVLSILMIIAGVVGLNLAGGTDDSEKTAPQVHSHKLDS